MKTTLENNTLTIYLEGRIDTNNASTVESDIFAAVHANPGAEIIVDAEKLEYISSAGLRVLMKLRKQVKKALSVLNVSRDVYDIFETTGFTELLDVKKALRVVSVEGCEKIGEGGVGAVYRLDKDTIIKVFKDKMTSASSESEMRMAKKAFQMGVPTAISYDVVKVGDGIGIVYELIDSDTLANEIMEQPDRLSEYARDYVNLLLEIQNIKVKPGELDDARTVLMRYAEGMAYFFPKEEVDKLRGLAATIPEGDSFVHGDFHLKISWFRMASFCSLTWAAMPGATA
jgi:anti-anti-sigma factor